MDFCKFLQHVYTMTVAYASKYPSIALVVRVPVYTRCLLHLDCALTTSFET
jgi:hypothetical protein